MFWPAFIIVSVSFGKELQELEQVEEERVRLNKELKTVNEGVKKKAVRERELETIVKGLQTELKEKLKTIK